MSKTTSGQADSGPDKTHDWPDIAGRIEGHRHILPVRVYFEDTDFSGLVYHANFLRFIERGRSDFIRLLGIHHTELLAGTSAASDEPGEPGFFVVRAMELDYLRPAHIDDLLEIYTTVGHIGGASLTLHQTVRKANRVIFKAKVTVVLVSAAGKPQRLGALVRERLARLEAQGDVI